MTSVDGTVNYRMEIRDNVTRVANRGKAAQTELKQTIEQSTVSMQQQTLEFISNVMAITALEGGINALAEAFTKLGIGSEEFAEQMRKVAAVTKLFTGTAQLVQGLIGVMRLLTKAEIALAAVETYRRVLNNPAAMAAVILGAGAAGAVGGYFAGKASAGGGDTNVQQTINFTAPTTNYEARSFQRDTLEMMGG